MLRNEGLDRLAVEHGKIKTLTQKSDIWLRRRARKVQGVEKLAGHGVTMPDRSNLSAHTIHRIAGVSYNMHVVGLSLKRT